MSFSLSNLEKTKLTERKRVGRGIGSSKGKTSGRGVKGQKARTGHHSVKGFEGGQTPIYMRLPKRGFKSFASPRYEIVNIVDLIRLVKSGNLDANCKVDNGKIYEIGLIKNKDSKVKLILTGNSKIDSSFKGTVTVDFYSKKAAELYSK